MSISSWKNRAPAGFLTACTRPLGSASRQGASPSSSSRFRANPRFVSAWDRPCRKGQPGSVRSGRKPGYFGGSDTKRIFKKIQKNTHKKKKHMPWHISPNAHTNPCKWTSLYSILIHFTYPIYDPWLFAAHSSNLTSKVTSIMGQFSSWLPIIWANKALM